MSKKAGRGGEPIPKCIFCGGSGLSREHLWPQWMGRHFHRSPGDTRVEVAARFDGQMNPLPGRVDDARRGHTVNVQIKTVCRVCNNGWMSRLDAAVKPFIEPMMFGQPAVLSEREQRTLVEWIVLKLMVFESARNVRAVSTPAMRREFYETRTFTANTHVFLFRHGDPTWVAQVHRHATGFYRPGDEFGSASRNTQVFTLGAGQLLIHIFQCLAADVVPRIDDGRCRRLWPLQGGDLIWPPSYTLWPGQPDILTSSLANHIKATSISAGSRHLGN